MQFVDDDLGLDGRLVSGRYPNGGGFDTFDLLPLCHLSGGKGLLHGLFGRRGLNYAEIWVGLDDRLTYVGLLLFRELAEGGSGR